MRRTIVIMISMLGLVAASCGETTAAAGGQSVGGEATTNTAGAAAETPDTTTDDASNHDTLASSPTAVTADRGPLESMLTVIPDTSAYREEIHIVDFSAATEISGQEAPSGDDPEAVSTFYRGLTQDGDPAIEAWAVGFDRPLEIESWRQEFGFSFLDVDRAILAGTVPSRLLAVHGPTLSGSVETAVRTDPTWSDYLTEATHQGQPLFLWSDPDEFFESSGPRPLSVGGSLAVVGDETVLQSAYPDAVKNGLDSVAGPKGSLADSPAFSSLASELDAHDVYRATLTNELRTLSNVELVRDASFGALPEEQEEAEQETARLKEAPTLPPYQALGLGHAFDHDGVPVLIVSFAMPDSDSADVMLDAFTVVIESGRSWEYDFAWSDLFTIRETEVVGNVSTIVLETDSRGRGFEALRNVDSLFVVTG